jgi:hypothetical protein
VSDNFQQMIDALKKTADRLRQAHEEIRRRLLVPADPKTPTPLCVFRGTRLRSVGRERLLSKNLKVRCAWRR